MTVVVAVRTMSAQMAVRRTFVLALGCSASAHPHPVVAQAAMAPARPCPESASCVRAAALGGAASEGVMTAMAVVAVVVAVVVA